MYESTNKEQNINMLNNYMYTKTLSMFEWANLPDTIPQKELEKLLQINGYAFITKVDGDLYAFTGSLGGESDVYGNPSLITISNTALKFNKTLDLKTDGVLINNDDLRLGLEPFFNKQSSLLVENDISMRIFGINSRTQKLISAPDNASKQSAEQYLRDIENGKLGVIGTNTLFEGIQVHTSNTGTGGIKDLLEYHQYLKSNLFNEVGLSSNFNMKRERLLSAEVDQSEDSLFPLVYNMLQSRLFAVEQINAMYNTDINLDFGSVWHYKNKKLVDGEIENDNENEKLDAVDIPNGQDVVHVLDEESRPEEPTEEPTEEIKVVADEIEDTEKVENVESDEEPQTDEEREQGQGPEPEPETVINDEDKEGK